MYRSKSDILFSNKVAVFILLLLVFTFPQGNAQSNIESDSSEIFKKRQRLLYTSAAVGYTGAIVGLSTIWYSDYEQGSFRFFNDHDEWKFQDKIGHITASYYIGRAGIGALRWAGVEDKKAIWYGGSVGFVFLTSVEVLDGFSKEWGFSPSDFFANAAGSALVIGQELMWHEQRITLKYSYSASTYAKYRPDKLGSDFSERWLKDYNGQTYWASANIHSFLDEDSNFPQWLNIAVGYGANGMLGAVENPTVDPEGLSIPTFERYSQWYLSPDIDLTRIKTNSKFLKTLFEVTGFIKIPTPTLEYNSVDSFKFHWLFF